MLFSYNRIEHASEKMHEFVEYIFMEVWCKARELEFSIELFEGNESLHNIMAELFRRDSAEKLKGAALDFYTGVNGIFIEFKQLTDEEIADYRHKFEYNNSIEELCENSGGKKPCCYGELNPEKVELNKQIEAFFKNLYSPGFFDLKFVRDEVGATIGDYYKAFVRRGNNDNDTCPFCGILPIDGEFDLTRDAFDHYLPKSKYPFNSVNLGNLCPSCNKCNSGNKRDKDPLRDKDNNPRKAFYPFADTTPDVAVNVKVKGKEWQRLTDDRIQIELSSEKYDDETKTWSELFRIDSRYSAKCCSKNGGIHWLKRIFDIRENYGVSQEDMLKAEIAAANSAPWVESNFLRAAFLSGCRESGLFEAQNV